MDIVKLNGIVYDVLVESITEEFNILYSENTGRTLATGAPMILDAIGTYYGHAVTFRRKRGYEGEFDRLFDFLSVPRNSGIDVEIVHGQSTLAYKAYVSSGSREVQRIDKNTGKILWGALEAKFTPIEAQVIPDEE